MTCEELLRLLDEAGDVDGRDATAHVAACPRCQALVERARAVRRELAAMGSEDPPPFLHARIMAHVRAESRASSPGLATRLRLAWSPVITLAAFAILIVGGGSLVLLKEKALRADRALAPGPEPAPPAVSSKLEAGADKPHDQLAREAVDELTQVERQREVAAARAKVAPSSKRAPAPVSQPAETEADNAPLRDEWRAEHQRRSQVTGALPLPPAPAAPEGSLGGERAASPAPGLGVAAGGPPESLTAASCEERKKDAAEGKGTNLAKVQNEPVPVDEPVVVFCAIVAETGGEPRRIELPVQLAPPPGTTWQVVVAESGRGRLEDTRGGAMPAALAEELASLIAKLDLAPGRYQLSRSHR